MADISTVRLLSMRQGKRSEFSDYCWPYIVAGSMTVQKLRALVQRLFKANPATLTISYINPNAQGPEVTMDNDMRQISFYGPEDGDTVLVRW